MIYMNSTHDVHHPVETLEDGVRFARRDGGDGFIVDGDGVILAEFSGGRVQMCDERGQAA